MKGVPKQSQAGDPQSGKRRGIPYGTELAKYEYKAEIRKGSNGTKTASLQSREAFIGLILAFASGFCLLLTLYAGLFVMFPLPCLCENAITSSLALKTAQRAFQ